MINPKDKKILIIAGICISIILLFWAFIYFPANKKLRILKAELNSIKGEIAQIESRGGGKEGYDIAKMIESIQKDFNAAMQKLPGQEEETLRFLSDKANKLGLDIVSMQPSPKRPLLDVNNNPVFLENKQCVEMSIAIQISGLYKSIGEYLKILRDQSPALIKVEGVRIQKDEAIAPRLRVNLELALCLLRES